MYTLAKRQALKDATDTLFPKIWFKINKNKKTTYANILFYRTVAVFTL